MFPRHAHDGRPGPRTGETAKLPVAEGPCPSCSAFIDELDGAVPHIAAHANLVVAAKAPIERVAAFGRERGWRHIRLVSSGSTTFARDYGGEVDGQQMPILNVFTRDGDTIRHFWASEMHYAPPLTAKTRVTSAPSRRPGTSTTSCRPAAAGDREERHDYA